MALRNTIGALFGALALGAVLAAVLAVSGCDIDSAYEGAAVSSNAEDPNAIVTTRIVGSVGDGPIQNARVRVFTNSGEELSETRSSNTADYEITVRTQGRNYPLTIVADQGEDMVTRAPPDFSLVSVVMGPGNNEIANLNPFGTLIVRTAEKSGEISAETIAAATDAVVERYGFGLGSSLVAHPIFSPMDDTNVHVVVKASETLGELIRRTRDALMAVNFKVEGVDGKLRVIDGDGVVQALAADLVDGWVDGRGAEGHDRRIAAVANVASAPVMLEALANRLYVYGVDSTPAMDAAITSVRGFETLTTADVTIPSEALMQARRALYAARLVTSDEYVLEALYAVQTTAPGSTQLNTLQSTQGNALNWAIHALNEATHYTASTIYEPLLDAKPLLDAINLRASSEEPPYLANPSEPAPSDEDSQDGLGSIVTAPEEETQENDNGVTEEEPIVGEEPIEPNSSPVISGTPTTALVVGQEWSFTPEAYDADEDVLTFSIEGEPDSAKFDPKTGRIWWTPHETGSYGQITITVSDGIDSASLDTFTLHVDEPTLGTTMLSWTPPTEREDGSTLVDLAGYRIYYGKDETALTHVINISEKGLTEHLIENLDSGTWYFAVTAYDSNDLESDRSNFTSKTIN